MINTIFYFPSSQQQYNAASSDLNSRTISFVPPSANETTGTIYKNGIRYSGYSRTEINNMIDDKAYDDTDLQNAITRIENSINTANDEIDTLNNNLDKTIQDLIDDTFAEYTWLKKNLGDVFAYQGFVNQLNAFLSAVGVLTATGGEWSSLTQTINSITGRVASLEGNNLTETQVKQWINSGIAGIDLTAYAQKSVVDGHTTLIGSIQTQVNTLQESVTTSLSSTVRRYLNGDLETEVDTYLQNQAGLILDSNLDHAVSLLFSRTQQQSHETLTALNTAGFLTESNLDGAIATMFASTGNGIEDSSTYAAIQAGLAGDSSFITAIADDMNIKGNQITIDATHKLTLNGNNIILNGTTWTDIINASEIFANNVTAFKQFKVEATDSGVNKVVSRIDNTGRAIFINGHIYMPYFATDWWENNERAIVGLYIDSIPAGSPDSNIARNTTYALGRYGGQYYPRTLFEPHGFAVEDGNKAVMSSIYTTPYFELVDGQNEMTSYSLDIGVYNRTSANNNAKISLIPNALRQGHDSSGGLCEIVNNTIGFSPTDYTTWTGKFWVHKWQAAEVEVSDEFSIKVHNPYAELPVDHDEYDNGANAGLNVIGNVTFDCNTYNPTNGRFRVNGNVVFDGSSFNSNVAINVTSDERLKTIIDNVEPTIEDIANVRVVDFKFNNDETNTIHTGSIAQDWQDILPNAVKSNVDKDTNEEYLSLNYDAVSVVSAVTAAKEIVKLKQENAELKERLAAIEAMLDI